MSENENNDNTGSKSNKEYTTMEFIAKVRRVGNGGLITLPAQLIGKWVKVKVKVYDSEQEAKEDKQEL